MSCDSRGFKRGCIEVCPMLYKRAPVASGSLEWNFNVRFVIKFFIVGVFSMYLCVSCKPWSVQ
jgi:hypothetical protein